MLAMLFTAIKRYHNSDLLNFRKMYDKLGNAFELASSTAY
jgi:hypothetical protein